MVRRAAHGGLRVGIMHLHLDIPVLKIVHIYLQQILSRITAMYCNLLLVLLLIHTPFAL